MTTRKIGKTTSRKRSAVSEPKKGGEILTALDVKERLVQDLSGATFLLWPPNLFAFTSYTLMLSGAYQLVVSPPPGAKTLYHWPPTRALLDTLLDRLIESRPHRTSVINLAGKLRAELDFAEYVVKYISGGPESDRYNIWTYLVRKTALDWRLQFEEMRAAQWMKHLKSIPIALDADHTLREADAKAKVPAFLLACWTLFEDLYLLADPTSTHTQDIASLLCNKPINPNAASDDREIPWLAAVSLITLHAISDDACVGWGIPHQDKEPVHFLSNNIIEALRSAYDDKDATPPEDAFERIRKMKDQEASVGDSLAQGFAADCLKEHGTMATINASRARVLPKRHNPDIGITLRSISSNLAFHHSPIEIVWITDTADAEHNKGSNLARKLALPSDIGAQDPAGHGLTERTKTFTMLLLPFPMAVHTKDFTPIDGPMATDALENRHGYGFFEYVSKTPTRYEEIKAVIEKAQDEEAAVDILVLPESAINADVRDKLLDYMKNAGKAPSVFIAGVNQLAGHSRFPRSNSVQFGFWPYDVLGEQHKHHRWQLNKSQILQYGLSQALPVTTKWWEAIDVGRRRVTFVNIGEEITLCPLICEDLARQDPIADLIRHVGPSLVITILMDGPQLKDRWSSRYAAILSEDPGSAVLALTSFGMVKRWNPRFGRLSKVVALWSDKEGSREIELERGSDGILLTLKIEAEREVIADGRLEMSPTAKITLADVIQIQSRENT
jgi:hypothetical protein